MRNLMEISGWSTMIEAGFLVLPAHASTAFLLEEANNAVAAHHAKEAARHAADTTPGGSQEYGSAETGADGLFGDSIRSMLDGMGGVRGLF